MPSASSKSANKQKTPILSPMLNRDITAKEIMDREFLFFEPTMNLSKALELLVDKGVSGGPVLDPKGKLLGFISERDLLRRIVEKPNLDLSLATVASYMREQVFTVSGQTGLLELAEMFLNHWFHIFPVLENETVLGIVSRRSVSKAMRSKIVSI